MASAFNKFYDAVFTDCHSLWAYRLAENPGWKVNAKTHNRLGGQMGADQSMAEKPQKGSPCGLVDHPYLGRDVVNEYGPV
jgi:hypothetical protein